MEVIVLDLLKTLTEKPVLCFPNWDAVQDGSRLSQLHTDASLEGFGAVLNQPQLDVSVRPIPYISRSTLPNEVNWSPLELEGGAITWAIKRLRQYLFQVPFQIYTDHGVHEQLAKVGEHNPRVQRWLEF